MTIRLYNTMTRRVEEFQPLDPPTVSLYTCGPTVYNYAHIGNLRTYVFEDVLVRALKLAGYNVNRVMNVTDVGHLISDADDGEDKMEKGARREGKTIQDIARFYYEAFVTDMHRLNLLPPEKWCWATDEIDTQKAQVEALAEKGFTYVIEDGIYFDTSKFPEYGKLAGQNLADLKAGARIELTAGKKNPTDFAVWKFSPKNEQRLMEWDNPCGIEGKGFPGWHIECSAMAIQYLGETLDIHCGGIDHVKVHHTNEIAQAEGALGHEWCRWWMHGEFLTMPKDDGGGKMSKSSGEFLTLSVLIRKLREMGFPEKELNDSDAALSYRYFLLNAHYRQQLTFTWDGLEAAANAYKKLNTCVVELREKYIGSEKPIEEQLKIFRKAVFDDLNMPNALAVMWKVANIGDPDKPNKTIYSAGDAYATLLVMDDVLGLGFSKMKQKTKKKNHPHNIVDQIQLSFPPEEVEDAIQRLQQLKDKYPKTPSQALADEIDKLRIEIIKVRKQAREDKNYSFADQIRDGMASIGEIIADTTQGFSSTSDLIIQTFPDPSGNRPAPGTAFVDEPGGEDPAGKL